MYTVLYSSTKLVYSEMILMSQKSFIILALHCVATYPDHKLCQYPYHKLWQYPDHGVVCIDQQTL